MFVLPLIIETVWGELKLVKNSLRYVISTVVFQILFSGFGEELLFRGFFQGELNRVFAKKFAFGRTRFGWGMVIAAVLFGLGHLLNPFNPLEGRFGLDVGAFLGTTIVGFGFGLAREHFGGLIAVSLIHGGGDLYVSLFSLTLPGQIAVGIALIVMYVGLGCVVFRGKGSAQIPNTQ
jgi:membrane protease YdiL (CAAX protease family)